ncbi:MAG: tetratricopeptide repeat protein, partial [Planctomycetota bacterium]
MARRRLNKKVALIGGLLFVLLSVMAILVILHFSRDPHKFIEDGDAALLEEQYDVAARNYNKAYGSAKSDSLRTDILFKLEDLYIRTDDWGKVLGCWGQIIQLDSKNVRARLGHLRYLYILADSGARKVWRDVAIEANEFLEKIDEKLLTEEVAKWDVFESEQDLKGRKFGPYLYIVKGRATLENTLIGAETDPDKSLAQAISDIEKVIELEPNDIEAYKYLAIAIQEKGRIAASKGNIEEKEESIQRAQDVLTKAIEVAGDNPEPRINLLSMKLVDLMDQKAGVEKILSLEPEYLSLVKKFDSSAKVFAALTVFYLRTGTEGFDKAIEAAEKASELDKENVLYAVNTADLYYRKYSIYKDIAGLHKAIKILNYGLILPGSQIKQGPRSWQNKMSRVTLYSVLARCYLEQVIEPFSEKIRAEKQEWLKKAEDVVHEIRQLYDSGDEPEVQKWQGMLELAKGNRASAIRRLYSTYEQMLAAETTDWLVSYTLGKFFMNTSETGAARGFLGNAIGSGIIGYKPEALLYFVEIDIRLRRYNEALSVLSAFEERVGSSQQSQLLKTEVYIGLGRFDEAKKELAKAVQSDPNTVKLQLALTEAHIKQLGRALAIKKMSEGEISVSEKPKPAGEPALDEKSIESELRNYRNDFAELLKKLFSMDPNQVKPEQLLAVCGDYIANGQIDEAKGIIELTLKQFPDSTSMLFYKQL